MELVINAHKTIWVRETEAYRETLILEHTTTSDNDSCDQRRYVERNYGRGWKRSDA